MSVSEMASCNWPNSMDHICKKYDIKKLEILRGFIYHKSIQSHIVPRHKGRNNIVRKSL